MAGDMMAVGERHGLRVTASVTIWLIRGPLQWEPQPIPGSWTRLTNWQPLGLTSEAVEQDGESQQEALTHFEEGKERGRAGSCQGPIYTSARLGCPRKPRGGDTVQVLQGKTVPLDFLFLAS